MRSARATRVLARATEGETTEATEAKSDPVDISDDALEKNLSKFAKKTATTFAPRQSGAAKKNPAYKGARCTRCSRCRRIWRSSWVDYWRLT